MLTGKTIAIPETRRLDILAQLLEAREGEVLRVPLVAIHDAPDPGPVLEWIDAFIARPWDELIIFTGEGVRRLLDLADRNERKEALVSALAATIKICRGPKPGRALSEVGLKPDIQAAAPTTDGVIETLEGRELTGHRVGVQLYGSDPNRKLMAYLEKRGASVFPVAPYVYADQSEEERVVDLIHNLAQGKVDVIAFTSQPQIHRLLQVARRHDLDETLRAGMNKAVAAAVGPVVRDQLLEAGFTVQIMPERTYFMKPLVSAIVKYFETEEKQA